MTLFVVISAGLVTDLILIGHYESFWQMIPLLLQLLAGFAVIFYYKKPIRFLEKVVNVMVILLMLSAFIGVGFHLHNNWEFEQELHPGQSMVQLFKNVLTGAIPVMAPGAMIVSGLTARLLIISKN